MHARSDEIAPDATDRDRGTSSHIAAGATATGELCEPGKPHPLRDRRRLVIRQVITPWLELELQLAECQLRRSSDKNCRVSQSRDERDDNAAHPSRELQRPRRSATMQPPVGPDERLTVRYSGKGMRGLVLVGCLAAASGGCDYVFRLDEVPPVSSADPTGWATVSAGTSATCGIRATDGALFCWGFNGEEQLGNGVEDGVFPTPQGPLRGAFQGTASWKTVDVGRDHACGIQDDDTLWCWGENGVGQLGIGNYDEDRWPVQVGTETWLAVSAGDQSTCAIRSDQRGFCWGENDEGELGNGNALEQSAPVEIAGGRVWRMVTVGESHSCGIDTSGAAFCWGSDYSGELGNDGETSSMATPVAVAGSIEFAQISAGLQVTCGVSTDGAAFCWGSNTSRNLGAGNGRDGSRVPLPLAGAVDWVEVIASETFSCGRRTNGEMSCWGDAEGTPLTGEIAETPTPVAANTAKIALGQTHTCKISTTGELACTGDGSRGAVGTLPNVATEAPVQVTGTWATVDAGNFTTCAIEGRSPPALYCWGTNHYGEVGDGSALRRIVPTAVPVPLGISVALVSVGEQHSCAAGGATVFCWGADYGGSLGNGQERSDSPVAVTIPTGDGAIVSVSASKSTCAIRELSTGADPAYCWGRNNRGQLGANLAGGFVAMTPVLVAVAGLQQISVGQDHVCAADGTKVYCWGRNDDGQVGDNSTTDRNAPVDITTSGGFNITRGTVAGFTRSCANTSSGTMACWGHNNGFAVLRDDGDTASSAVPALLSRMWQRLAIGDNHTCGIDAQGQLWCWGRNDNGQVGDGTRTARNTPVRITNAIDWDDVTAGARHTCAHKADKTLWCWGDNSEGQLGTGMGWTREFIVMPLPP